MKTPSLLMLLLFSLLHLCTSFSFVSVLAQRTIAPATSCSRKVASSLYFSLKGKEVPEDPVLRLPLLEAELAQLSSSDPNDLEAKAELQQEIENAHLAAEFGVRKAQLEFYEAFTARDLAKMKSIWSTEHQVSCIHPGMPSLEGLPRVLESWKAIFENGDGFEILAENPQISISGATATCMCEEHIDQGAGGKLEALNIYKRENGLWRMTMHMANPVL